MMRSVGGGSRMSLNSQRSEHSLRSTTGSRSSVSKPATPQKSSPARSAPPKNIPQRSTPPATSGKLDMFTTQSARPATAPSQPKASPPRTTAKPSMMVCIPSPAFLRT